MTGNIENAAFVLGIFLCMSSCVANDVTIRPHQSIQTSKIVSENSTGFVDWINENIRLTEKP